MGDSRMDVGRRFAECPWLSMLQLQLKLLQPKAVSVFAQKAAMLLYSASVSQTLYECMGIFAYVGATPKRWRRYRYTFRSHNRTSEYVCVWEHEGTTTSHRQLFAYKHCDNQNAKKRNRYLLNTKIPEAITKASGNCVKIRAINAVVVMMAFGTCQQGEWERATPQKKSREQWTHKQRLVCCCMLWVYGIWLGLFGACLWRGALFGYGYSEEVWVFVSLQESEYIPLANTSL